MSTIHIFKLKRRNSAFWKGCEASEFLANRAIDTACSASVFVKQELWPAVRDHLEFVGVRLYNAHVKLADLRHYHFIADSDCFEILQQLAAEQPPKAQVRVQPHGSAEIEFPPVLGFEA